MFLPKRIVRWWCCNRLAHRDREKENQDPGNFRVTRPFCLPLTNRDWWQSAESSESKYFRYGRP